jgi:hypothetical protein
LKIARTSSAIERSAARNALARRVTMPSSGSGYAKNDHIFVAMNRAAIALCGASSRRMKLMMSGPSQFWVTPMNVFSPLS